MLLHFGSSDEKMVNLKIINILKSYNKKIKLSVILGPALSYKLNIINKLLEKLKYDYKIYNYPKTWILSIIIQILQLFRVGILCIIFVP